MPERTPCWPGFVSSLHLESSERRALFRKRSVPSRRPSLHLGPVYRATFASYRSDTTTLGRPAAVVRNRRDVRNAGDLDPERIERAHCGFATGAGPLDADFQVLHAALDGHAAGLLGSDLSGERRRLARALEAGAAGRRPRQGAPLAVGDRDDRVVERRMDVRDAFGHVLLDLLAHTGAGLRGLRCLCHSLVVLPVTCSPAPACC